MIRTTCYIPQMAHPPIFDRNTHERQKNLLAAEERRLRGKEDWKIMGQFGLLLLVGAIFLVSIIAVIASWLR